MNLKYAPIKTQIRYLLKDLKRVVVTLFKRAFCRHREYEILAISSCQHTDTDSYHHGVTFECVKCGKHKYIHYIVSSSEKLNLLN